MSNILIEKELGRRQHDFYETPPHYVRALLKHIEIHARYSIYEPCIGDWSIVNELPPARKLGTIFTNDIDSLRVAIFTNDIDSLRVADTHFDATKAEAWQDWYGTNGVLDWCITNPPFSAELPILQHALAHSVRVAFLARLSFLEPTADRRSLLETKPPAMIIVLPRYSFRNNDAGKRQTDNVTCCWMVWGPDVKRGIFVEGARA